ncbi:hypothetical protein ElyMa_004906300 [Elysia marginata]|uniref:Uncharacterized protein n=1 Tax=Elysia marginata TaxID=1093978 RepID=A0AAV4J0V8_9GAST|nr:hypothetical protein ElyMa_004906300 [Elysia marginata]
MNSSLFLTRGNSALRSPEQCAAVPRRVRCSPPPNSALRSPEQCAAVPRTVPRTVRCDPPNSAPNIALRPPEQCAAAPQVSVEFFPH